MANNSWIPGAQGSWTRILFDILIFGLFIYMSTNGTLTTILDAVLGTSSTSTSNTTQVQNLVTPNIVDNSTPANILLPYLKPQG